MIRIGIIGTGEMAHIHIVGLLTSNQYEIAGCYAPENRQSMTFARKYRLISYSSVEALFKYADAIDIIDDLPETIQLAELSLKAMKHVFIVHPDRLNIKQMQYLKKLAEKSGVVLQLGTGYLYCPVYNKLGETMQKAMLVDIRHQIVFNTINLAALTNLVPAQMKMQLSYNLDFVTSILNANIIKIDVKQWNQKENLPNALHCRIVCDNGSMINLMVYTIAEGEPNTEVIFTSSDDIIRAIIFKSIIEKQSRTDNTVNKIKLEAFNEKIIHQQYLKNFYQAICNEHDAIKKIEKLYQNIAAADDILERVN